MSANHCVPVYDTLPVPEEEDRVIIVMPLLQDYLRPPFNTIGEAVECFRQLLEVGLRTATLANCLLFVGPSFYA